MYKYYIYNNIKLIYDLYRKFSDGFYIDIYTYELHIIQFQLVTE